MVLSGNGRARRCRAFHRGSDSPTPPRECLGAPVAARESRRRAHPQPAERECEHARRRRIKPLLVVDRDQDRAGSGELAQHAQDCARKGLDVARALRQLAQEQGCTERVLLRIRERVEVVRKPLEQIAQPRERKHRLWLGGRRLENPEAAPPSASTASRQRVVFPIPGLPSRMQPTGPDATASSNSSGARARRSVQIASLRLVFPPAPG